MLKQIHQFITESPSRLSSQLSAFEGNIKAETDGIRATYQPALVPRKFTSVADTIASVLPGQLALCDSNLGNVTVTLSAPDKTPGWLAIVKRFAANNVNVFPSGLSAAGVARRINATTSKTYAAVGMYWIYYDGSDWWA